MNKSSSPKKAQEVDFTLKGLYNSQIAEMQGVPVCHALDYPLNP
jgi:hypothetical protein